MNLPAFPRAALIFCLLGAVGAAAAPKPMDPLAVATEAMGEADFEKVLSVLDAALGKTRAPAELAKLQLLRGQALVALQKPDEARQAFSAALAANPAARLDAKTTSPDALNTLEKARRLVASELSISVLDGAAADIRLDDVELGPTPLKTRTGGGMHRLEARNAGGQKVSKDFEVLPGKPLALSLDFAAAGPPPPTPPPEPPPSAAPSATRSAVAPAKTGVWKLGFLPLGLGVGLGAGGAVLLLQAQDRHARLTDPRGMPLSKASERQLANEGSMFQTLGFLAIGIGGAAVLTGTAMLIFLGNSSASGTAHASLLVTPQGAFVGLDGTF